jgi:deazaflavin-dependent oxidoreductase (nitroreductase family)
VAATYRLTIVRRLANAIVRPLLRLGLGPARTHLLTVRGRRSGEMRSTPVTLVESEGQRWLVAPYGPVDWVRNARATGRATLFRGRRTETVTLAEVDVREAAPILRHYAREVPITRSFFDAGPDSRVEAFAAEATRHPVFRINPGSAEREPMRASPARSA